MKKRLLFAILLIIVLALILKYGAAAHADPAPRHVVQQAAAFTAKQDGAMGALENIPASHGLVLQ